jgi:hypothetical protein
MIHDAVRNARTTVGIQVPRTIFKIVNVSPIGKLYTKKKTLNYLRLAIQGQSSKSSLSPLLENYTLKKKL